MTRRKKGTGTPWKGVNLLQTQGYNSPVLSVAQCAPDVHMWTDVHIVTAVRSEVVGA